MTPIDKEEAHGKIAKAILLLAIEDYVQLRVLGCVRYGVVEKSMWNYEIGKDWRFSPLGYNSAASVETLVEFLNGPCLNLFCDGLGYQASLIRKRIGLVPSLVPMMNLDEMPWLLKTDKVMSRWLKNDGSHHVMPENVVADSEDIAQEAA